MTPTFGGHGTRLRDVRSDRGPLPLGATLLRHPHPVGQGSVFDPVGDPWVAAHLVEELLFPGGPGGVGGESGAGGTVSTRHGGHRTHAWVHSGGHQPVSPVVNSAHTAVPKSAQKGKGTTG
ncbi:hypothetical protein GCM10009602_58290 [Nocardiopsis tropica]